MRYWWVNQNQTYQQEVDGGYLWSPKRNQGGRRNPFYDFMREVAPGDIIFSFSQTWIQAIGVASSHAYEAPKPAAFGTAGAYWDNIGWRVDVRFTHLDGRIRPSDHMSVLRPLLPQKYAPLRHTGRGFQHVYLTRLPELLAGALVDLIGREARNLVQGLRVAEQDADTDALALIQWEEHELEELRQNRGIENTVREAVILARRGQGVFKEKVMRIEKACRITGIKEIEHLRASHCKPWRDSSNEERLDGENGLLLTPNVDHLFDRGFIAFEDDGGVLISPVASKDALQRMGINVRRPPNVGRFSSRQKAFLEFHRENVLLRSRFLEES